ncbi:MAG TPA: biotin-dependent carboxyltransferase family protein [Candidatus Dormibacteraeota bacterium]|nr:biotin-dependent carboxyltransferase family protein [Candidatus Dormibacteraeota bacterium]
MDRRPGEVLRGQLGRRGQVTGPPAGSSPAPSVVLHVEEAGMFSTIQDLGRPGRRAAGVPPGGAMDRFALSAANLLVGNPEGAAALECALSGPTLVAVRTCLVAVTGADFGATLNGRALPGWTGVFLSEGDRLAFTGRRWGARAYVAVAGGLAGDRWLGSAATYLLVGRGGVHGRPLQARDVLSLAAPAPRPVVVGRCLPDLLRPAYAAEPELSAIGGPHAGLLAPASRRALFREPWQVSRDADRMGYRLEGEVLTVKSQELVSFGLAMGCVQVPPAGQPILLMADHQTAGGYPVVAGVARCDLPLAAQLLPGQRLRFREVGVEEAQGEWRRLRAALDGLKR